MDRQALSPSPANDLLTIARRLRNIRAASQKFLALWALQQDSQAFTGSRTKDKQLADPMNHDWSLLYMGSVLDD